jgi:hypothetical protein
VVVNHEHQEKNTHRAALSRYQLIREAQTCYGLSMPVRHPIGKWNGVHCHFGVMQLRRNQLASLAVATMAA